MGLGPSIKMTTLHHFRCPATHILSEDSDIEFTGIIVDGVSENCDDKIYTAKRVGDIARSVRADGALVAIDGWGNHHIDFVNVIEQLGIRQIPSVGLSYIGLQGRLVCTNSFVDSIIDFNKNESGYESCVVGQNNLTDYDAFKALGLLKNKLRKAGKLAPKKSHDSHTISNNTKEKRLSKLVRKVFTINEVSFSDKTYISNGKLFIEKNIAEKYLAEEPRIKNISVDIIPPGDYDRFVNSNLDFSPIACKINGELGEGTTHLITGVTLMLNGVEDKSSFQPSNIGSSEGILKNRFTPDMAGTAASNDYILHVDILFNEGEGRTSEGIYAAHRIADRIAGDIRRCLANLENMAYKREEFYDIMRPDKPKIILVKIVSGLGNMYDTAMFPYEPGGVIGARNMMGSKNLPYIISPNQCRDGVIHSLL
ncbi:glycine/sarcosine/betaine reductase component B subunit [Johnsonella ignava]|uniref:glycine/sarcosine/betaine reductase component B subunit n=1 Tax=Johnsonella ignava TaxID=43995 RepID=UPI0023F53993|nr:glycine/sarcosine/betaine reductase component B subunit [Johnsonella ignava]